MNTDNLAMTLCQIYQANKTDKIRKKTLFFLPDSRYSRQKLRVELQAYFLTTDFDDIHGDKLRVKMAFKKNVRKYILKIDGHAAAPPIPPQFSKTAILTSYSALTRHFNLPYLYAVGSGFASSPKTPRISTKGDGTTGLNV